MSDHEHVWGDMQHGWLTGTPSRPCTVEDCRFITLDLNDDEDLEHDDALRLHQ